MATVDYHKERFLRNVDIILLFLQGAIPKDVSPQCNAVDLFLKAFPWFVTFVWECVFLKAFPWFVTFVWECVFLRRIFRPFSFTHHRTVVYFIGFLLIYSGACCCRLYVERCTHWTPSCWSGVRRAACGRREIKHSKNNGLFQN